MRAAGLIAIILSCLIPAWMFLNIPNVTNSGALFSQYIGVVALILMAWAQMMATRLPGIEALMGSMDRVYVLHKWSGIIAMAAILFHDTLDAEIDGRGRENALSDLAETLGELSLYGLLILVVISVATFIPYHLWKWTHKAMGSFFAAGTFHFIFIQKPFDNTSALGLYVLVFCGLGVVAYGVTLLPTSMRRSAAYVVETIRQTGGATEITMSPKGRAIKFQPGQFAIFSFGTAGLAEPHPYSLSAPAADDGKLQITVKALGDYTYRLGRDLSVGDTVRVQGPFGRFVRRAPKSASEIWIAGGIGITPFVAWAEALPNDLPRPVTLFWCVKSAQHAPQLDRINAAVNRVANLNLVLISSAQAQRLDADQIASTAGGRAKIWFCGPAGLRQSLQKGLSYRGVSARDFHFEEFEFRTGVGLKKLAAWVAKRVQAKLIPAE